MTFFDGVFRRGRLQDDVADEVAAHIDERIADLVASGMPVPDAMARARREFGNVTRVTEDARSTWAWPAIDSFFSDVRLSLRQMRRAPALAAIIVTTLALGIAATGTVLGWTRSVLFNPLPGAADPERVVAIETTTASGSWTASSWLDYRDFRDNLTSFDGIAAAFPIPLALGDQVRTERRSAELVSANFFDVLRVRPALGSFFSAPADDAEGARAAVVVSYGLWQARWHRDSSVIGSVVHLNGYPFTVIGVAPREFRGSMLGEEYQLWVPAAMLNQVIPTGGWWLRDRGTRTFRVLARMAPGTTIARARQEVEALTARMSAANAQNLGMSGLVLPLWQSHWGIQEGLRAPLMLLLGAAGLVLLIVCANMANLLLARSMGRGRELALRLALGAPRSRLVRQLLTEASVPALLGSALGLAGAVWLVQSIGWLLPAFAAPSIAAPRVDAAVLAIVCILACAVTLAGGLLPAWHGSRGALGTTLRAGARGSAGGLRSVRLRSALVAAEMALAVASLVGAGMFFRSYRNTRAVEPGFDASQVAVGSVSVTIAGYDSARAERFLTDVVGRIGGQPGVTSVSYVDFPPLGMNGNSWEDLQVDGYAPQLHENMKIERSAVGPDYFKTLGIPLVEGREFTTEDDSAHARAMIVNETFVQRYLAGRPRIGVRVNGWGNSFTIVGVVKDVKTRQLTEGAKPYFYVPVRQVYRPEYGYTFLARTRLDVDQAVTAITSAVKAADPSVPVYNAMPMRALIAGPLRSQQAAAELLGILAAVAVLLAAIGLYGVTSFLVTQQTREFGVRIALGARPSNVAAVVASQAGVLLALGLAAGLAAGVALGRVVGTLLYGVGPGDVGVLAGATIGMTIVAALAAAVPARRATTVDPMVALRTE